MLGHEKLFEDVTFLTLYRLNIHRSITEILGSIINNNNNNVKLQPYSLMMMFYYVEWLKIDSANDPTGYIFKVKSLTYEI